MKKFLYLLLLISYFSFSQSPAGIWYFGDKAGISFNSGVIPVVLNDGQLNTYEGCATLSDVSGNLLFYTDGKKVWNKNHVIMPNGEGLLGNSSSTQSAIIVPKPNSNNLYYIFTVDYLGNSNGLNYNIVDINLEGGLGDVISKNNLLTTPTLEKVTVVKHNNNVNFWIISHKYNSAEFVSYELSESGIGLPVVSTAGAVIHSEPGKTVGYLKSSPNGELIACANSEDDSSIQLFKFNNLTGQLTLISTSGLTSNPIGAYGVEFSPNSKLLYVTKINTINNSSQIYQYDISVLNETIINNSRILIADYANVARKGLYGGLQLAPNQKIYVARNDYSFIGVINNPNTIGTGCFFDSESVNLSPNKSYYGLPAFITSLFNINFISSNYCIGNTTQFNTPNFDVILSTSWNFGDTASTDNTSTVQNPTHVFTSIGTYTVVLTVQTATGSTTFSDEIEIVNSPVANQPTDYNLCVENFLTDDFMLSTKDDEILGTQNSTDYTISYHLNSNDANNNINSVTNVINPQTIYARVKPTSSSDCYDVTSFELIKNLKPQLEADVDIAYCINDYPNLITLSAENQVPNDTLTYLWNTGETTETIQINQANIYSVTALNIFGCTSTRTITVTNSEIATIDYTIEGTIGNYNLVVNPIGIGNYVYAIDNEFGVYQTNNIFNDLFPGEHTIYVKDTKGCGIVSDEFSVIGYPNFFTPNDDGVNDYWKLTGLSADIKQILIFDRFGKLIYHFNQNTVGWDGTYNGKKMPSSDYWFVAKQYNGNDIKGHFSLIR